MFFWMFYHNITTIKPFSYMLLLYSVKDVIIKKNAYDKFFSFTYFNIRMYMPKIKEYKEKESKVHLEGFIFKALFILEK